MYIKCVMITRADLVGMCLTLVYSDLRVAESCVHSLVSSCKKDVRLSYEGALDMKDYKCTSTGAQRTYAAPTQNMRTAVL